jgi:hypothetical protein
VPGRLRRAGCNRWRHTHERLQQRHQLRSQARPTPTHAPRASTCDCRCQRTTHAHAPG